VDADALSNVVSAWRMWIAWSPFVLCSPLIGLRYRGMESLFAFFGGPKFL